VSADVNLTLALPPELVDALTERVAARLAEREQVAPEPWLTTAQAAEHLALSPSQLYTLVSQRKRNGLPVLAEGSRRYFRASELDAWRLANGNGRRP
jgi:excisionase family DNA binding protein